MMNVDDAEGTFCLLDLAAADAKRAQDFYAQTFGWSFRNERANGGAFTRCIVNGREIATLYQLNRAQLTQGVPSHWTPYIHVRDMEAAVRRLVHHGGRVIVSPFNIAGTARIALTEDAVGALVGIWTPVK